MHPEVSQFITEVKKKYPAYFEQCNVLEVGSLNINGTIRDLFKDCMYIGLDIGMGPGVDVVCPIHEFHPEIAFDTLVSTEMLEHDQYWQESLQSMHANLRPGGLFIFTCAGPQRHEHGTRRTTPQDAPFCGDYYRNISIEDFVSILPLDLFSDSHIRYERGQCDLYFYGIKKLAESR